jgi:hypothetical protein
VGVKETLRELELPYKQVGPTMVSAVVQCRVVGDPSSAREVAANTLLTCNVTSSLLKLLGVSGGAAALHTLAASIASCWCADAAAAAAVLAAGDVLTGQPQEADTVGEGRPLPGAIFGGPQHR